MNRHVTGNGHMADKLHARQKIAAASHLLARRENTDEDDIGVTRHRIERRVRADMKETLTEENEEEKVAG
jgi:hypothetical protein